MVPAEQLAAMATFRGFVGRLRVSTDGEGWPMVAGRYGRIEWHDRDHLAVFTDRPRIAIKLRALSGAHQVGDGEFRGVFQPPALPAVARLVGARRRKEVSPATAANLAAGAAMRFTSRRQGAPGPG